jgi:polyhydroxybutyrate depolymerase
VVGIVVVAVVVLVVAVVVHTRGDQDVSLPPEGQPLPTAPPNTPPGHTAKYTATGILQGDTSRSLAIVSPPDAAPGERLPAVIVVHGLNGSGAGELDLGHWDSAVTQHRFVAVFPQSEGGSWNAGRCCRTATTLGIGDVAFLEAIVTDLTRRPEIDPTRIYMVGDSNGGMLAYAFLCTHASQLAGAASVSGTNSSGCEPDASVPVLHVAGTADEVVPYQGGTTAASLVFASSPFEPVPRSVAEVAAREGCGAAPSTSTVGSVRTDDWSGCRDDSRVRLVTIDGAPHQWPTGEPYDATTEVLRFFGLAT